MPIAMEESWIVTGAEDGRIRWEKEVSALSRVGECHFHESGDQATRKERETLLDSRTVGLSERKLSRVLTSLFARE